MNKWKKNKKIIIVLDKKKFKKIPGNARLEVTKSGWHLWLYEDKQVMAKALTAFIWEFPEMLCIHQLLVSTILATQHP